MVSACLTHRPGGSSNASAPPLSYLRNSSISFSFRPAAWRGEMPALSRWSGSAAYANSSASIWYCFWRTARCAGASSVMASGCVTLAPLASRMDAIFWSPNRIATIRGRWPVLSRWSTSFGFSNSVCSTVSMSPSSTSCTMLPSFCPADGLAAKQSASASASARTSCRVVAPRFIITCQSAVPPVACPARRRDRAPPASDVVVSPCEIPTRARRSWP
mmetsp:Transcript_10345/g.26542  ORF Transcript_10345/g.26542 Transcript_10345/m.26542 type:complete len:217 (-) Transcript_10345:92-742(-)